MPLLSGTGFILISNNLFITSQENRKLDGCRMAKCHPKVWKALPIKGVCKGYGYEICFMEVFSPLECSQNLSSVSSTNMSTVKCWTFCAFSCSRTSGWFHETAQNWFPAGLNKVFHVCGNVKNLDRLSGEEPCTVTSTGLLWRALL